MAIFRARCLQFLLFTCTKDPVNLFWLLSKQRIVIKMSAFVNKMEYFIDPPISSVLFWSTFSMREFLLQLAECQ